MSDTTHRASWRPTVAAALATTVAAAASVYALGAAIGWWGGNNCALAACGAEDVGWAWLLLGTAVGLVTGLFALLTVQTIRDSGKPDD